MNKVEAAKELMRRLQARDSLLEWVKYLDMGFDFAVHHRRVIAELEAVERGETKNLMLILPPGSAKSTYASILFPSWYLGRNSKNSIIAASHTLELAERFGRRVRNIVGGQEYKAVFDSGLSEDSQAAGRWETKEGGEYFSAGVGGSITGRRADLGIIDDPVKSREDADSEIRRENTWQWYINDFLTRLKPNSRRILIMTRWHEDDLAGRILLHEPGEWKVVHIKMEAGDNDPLGRPEGALLWPEWFTQEMVDLAKRDTRSWSALYQGEPRPLGGGEFRREWVNYYDGSPETVKDGTNRYLLVDAANEKRKTSDYTAMWMMGLRQDDNIYVLDIVRDRLNLTERCSEVMRLHRKWKPRDVRYEKYGMMADIDHIKFIQGQQNYRFSISEVGGQTAKNDRIRRLVPYFEEGRVWFPKSLHRTLHDGITRELVNEFIEQELLAFPVGRHDDMLDALARLVEPDLPLTWPKIDVPQRNERYSRRETKGSVWTA
jgi:predicted phage terminase large subunit-like protein